MNYKRILFLGIALALIWSCRDKKKEKAEDEAVVKEVEALEAEIEENAKSLESDTKDLKEALEELDSI